LCPEKENYILMETTSYRSPFEKVYRRTKRTLEKKGFTVIEDKEEAGVIYGRRKKTFFKAERNLKVVIKEIDEASTSLTVYSDSGNHLLDKDGQKNRVIESQFIAMMTTRI
jgi:hypothetical protein